MLSIKSETERHIIEAKNRNENNMIYFITINSLNYSIEKIEMKDSISDEIINTFLTLTYDYNLTVPLSLFNFDISNYDNYILIQ